MSRECLLRRLVALSMIACLCVLAGCEKPQEEGPVRIGLVAYLKGEGRETAGLDMLIAAQMVVEKVNREGGVMVAGKLRPLELVVKEIENSAEQAVNAVRELINRHQVVAIIGPQYSSDAIPAGEVAEKSNIPLFAPIATHPDVTRGRRFVFRVTFLDEAQAEAMVSFAREELQVHSAAIVFDVADSYSRGLAEAFENEFARQGGEVLASLGAVRSEMLQPGFWHRVAGSGADVLYLPLYNPTSGKVANLAREAGYQGIVLGSDGWDWRFESKLKALQGAYMTTSWSSKLEMPKTRNFIQQYTKISGRDPGDTPALTYDALTLLASVIERQGSTDGEALRQGILEHPALLGVAGSLDYVDSGDPVKPVIIVKLKDGEALFQKFVVR